MNVELRKAKEELKCFEGFAEALKSSPYAPTKKGIYCAVKLARSMPELKLDNAKGLMQGVLVYLGNATPRQFMSVFPPRKEYDGERYHIKDYFSTMEAVEKHGMDTPLAERVFEFLSDYNEEHVLHFVCTCMEVIDRDREAHGKRSMVVEFMESLGVPPHYRTTDGYGREVLMDSVTGECTPITKPKPKMPRWWKVIKGNN